MQKRLQLLIAMLVLVVSVAMACLLYTSDAADD